MKLKVKLWPGPAEVTVAVVSEDDGMTLSTAPLWRVVDDWFQLCSEVPQPEDRARHKNLADAFEAQASRLRAAAKA